MNKKTVIVGLVFLAIACVLIAPQAEAVYYEETMQIEKKIDYRCILYSSDTVFVHSKISMQGVSGRSINSSALLNFETEAEKADLTFKYDLSVNQAKEANITQYAGYTSSPRSAALGTTIERLKAGSFSIDASVKSPTLERQLRFFGKNISRQRQSLDMYYKDWQVGAKWITVP